MRLKEFKQEQKWNPEDYSYYLERLGYTWPTKETRETYITVTGQSKHYPKKKPFGLVTYHPEKREYHFDTPGKAYGKLMELNPNKWQIINLQTGKILLDPNRRAPASIKNDSTSDTD